MTARSTNTLSTTHCETYIPASALSNKLENLHTSARLQTTHELSIMKSSLHYHHSALHEWNTCMTPQLPAAFCMLTCATARNHTLLPFFSTQQARGYCVRQNDFGMRTISCRHSWALSKPGVTASVRTTLEATFGPKAPLLVPASISCFKISQSSARM